MLSSVWLILLGAWLASVLLGALAASLAGIAASRLLAVVTLFISAMACGMLLGLGVNLLSLGFLAVALYRVVVMARVIVNRLQRNNLRRRSLKAELIFAAVQLLLLLASAYWPTGLAISLWLDLVVAGQLVIASLFLLTFLSQFKNTKFTKSGAYLTSAELPTLTVAIPAKNENSSLEKCLNSLIASDYPKLEILVLDDSAGSRTGEIIRNLAHDGARFILGEQPSGRWLAKNLAYDRLTSEANGEIIMYCGVDVRFSPRSLREVVQKFVEDDLAMLGVMPTNTQNPKSFFIQPMRYFWELARPRTSRSLPVLSTCWLVRRNFIKNCGGFRAVANEVVPERYFAKIASSYDKYRFLRSSPKLGVTSTKPASDQRLTAIRTRYPLLHNRLGLAAGASCFTIASLLAPFGLVVLLPLFGLYYGEILAVLTCLIWLAIYMTILQSNFETKWWLAPSFVLAAIFEIYLVNLSLFKYEFGRVMWKGRDVAYPATSR